MLCLPRNRSRTISTSVTLAWDPQAMGASDDCRRRKVLPSSFLTSLERPRFEEVRVGLQARWGNSVVASLCHDNPNGLENLEGGLSPRCDRQGEIDRGIRVQSRPTFKGADVAARGAVLVTVDRERHAEPLSVP